MEKYYTPSQNEIHPGFECEVQPIGEEEFIKHQITGADIDIRVRNVKQIRVKYLDKEDIENLGWNESILYTAQFEIKMILPEAVCGGIKINKITYFIDFIDENTLNIRMFNLDNIKYTMQKDNITPILIFHGKIKNKSELKKLMQQLNIIK
jgi:hypothetical protein